MLDEMPKEIPMDDLYSDKIEMIAEIEKTIGHNDNDPIKVNDEFVQFHRSISKECSQTDNDTNGVCSACLQAGNRVSIILDFGYFIIQDENFLKNELLLSNVCTRLFSYCPKFKSNPAVGEFLTKLWRLCIKESISPTVQAQLADMYPDFLHHEITKLLERSTMQEIFDETLLTYSQSFIDLVQLCTRCKHTFQTFTKLVADKMIADGFPNSLQLFLNCILTNIRKQVSNVQFRAMYKNELLCHIVLLSQTTNFRHPKIMQMLNEVKDDCYLNYIILVTHFPKLLFMLN